MKDLRSSRDLKSAAQFDSWLEEAAAGDDPIIVGPWVGEVGWELLYWIPFLRWAVDQQPELKDRLVVISRGGVSSWYQRIAGQYVDAFDLVSVAEMKEQRGKETEGKDHALKTSPRRDAPLLNALLIQRACSRLGIERHQTFEEAMVFRLVQDFAAEPLSEVESRLMFEPIEAAPPPPEIDLPDSFVAIRFYYGPATPDKSVSIVLRSLVEKLARLAPIVVLDPGLSVDDHRDLRLKSSDVIRLPPMEPSTNLEVQTSIIARSALFVGSYGGLSYLGPLLGVSTVALITGRSDSKSLPMPEGTRRADRPFGYGHFHLAVARRAFAGPGFGAYHVLEHGDNLELAALSAAAGTISSRAPDAEILPEPLVTGRSNPRHKLIAPKVGTVKKGEQTVHPQGNGETLASAGGAAKKRKSFPRRLRGRVRRLGYGTAQHTLPKGLRSAIRRAFKPDPVPQAVTYDWDRIERELSSLNRTLRRFEGRKPSDSSADDELVRRVRRIIGKHEHVLAGPWAGEIGYELLYWIPFLRWLTREIPELAEQLTVCSRGGVDSWYADITPRYLELFDLMAPDDIARERSLVQDDVKGGLATPVGVKRGGDMEARLIGLAVEAMGVDKVAVISTGLLYKMTRRMRSPSAMYGVSLEPKPIVAPETSLDLPERFAAVRFYGGQATPRDDDVRETVARIVERLAEIMPVVSMDPGVRLDRHKDFDLSDVLRLPSLDPAVNLRELTGAIARASVFVGSYGGFSYIAPHLGVSTTAWLARPLEDRQLTHLAMVRRLFASPDFGDYVVVTPKLAEQSDVTAAVSEALSQTAASG